MKVYLYIYILLISLAINFPRLAEGQDSLVFDGQLSAWLHYNPSNKLSFYAGSRYLPILNYSIPINNKEIIDFEVTANLYGSFGTHSFDSSQVKGKIKPYRAWVRFSSDQFELRLGLQKINFGSAALLRPLMWFDQLDPRDPLQLTDGVWGLLGRYYFLNNANVWLWGLWGNQKRRGWELIETNKKYPEFGGRFQTPVPGGEAALSYHYRMADSRGLDGYLPSFAEIPENKIGLDAKWDLEVGIWLEGTWVKKNRNLGPFTNQEILNTGMDYSFGIGNGLTLILEHLITSYDERAFQFSQAISFTGFSASYPVGLFDNLSGIVYYDWTHDDLYNFINWQRKFDKTIFYIMAYWNPKNYQMPMQQDTENFFAGKGIQFMFVYNH